jgi:hypothetical protein
MAKGYLSSRELAERWSVSIRTIQNWRVRKVGPSFERQIKGAAWIVRYRLTEVIKYEKLTSKTRGTRF